MTTSRGCAAFFTLYLAALLCAPLLVAQESQWKQLSAQARNLEQQGKYADALPIAIEALKAAESELGPDDPWVSVPASNLAQVYDVLGRYAEAEPLYQRALQIHEKAFGPENPLVAIDSESLGVLYFRQSQYAKAEPLFERALHIQEKALPPADAGLATYLENLAMNYVDEGKYAEAEPLYERVLPIYEKTRGPDDPDLSVTLNNLAHLYDEMGKYSQAEPLYKRTLAVREKVLGPEHAGVATVLNNLAALYDNQGRYAEAEPLYQRALAIREKTFGPDAQEVAVALNNLAALYDHQGKYTDGELLYLRALRIDEKALGADTPGVATDLNNLATLYFHQGQYSKAEPIVRNVLRINEKTLGPDDRNVASALINLAGLSVRQGEYAEAEPLYQRALRIYEKVLGPEHRDVATALNNLAALYVRQGKYAEAEPLYQRALSIREKALGPEHSDVAASLNNLAALQVDQARYADAEALYQRALKIYEKALGPEHPAVASSLNNLAQLYFNQGKFTDAEPLYQRALRINEKALGPDHPAVATALNNLALLYDRQGKYPDAESLFLRALHIDEKALGTDHPDVVTDLNDLAMLYDHQQKHAVAEPLFQRAFDNLFHQFQYSFTYMTENERLEFLDSVGNDFPFYFSFVHRYRARDPQLIGSMYNLLLWEKSSIVGSVANMRRQVEASGDTESIKLLGELSAKRSQKAALLNVEPPDRDLWRKQIDQLETDANDIEKSLVARSAAFAEQKKLERATWQQIRDTLKPDEASVEFARFDYNERGWTGKTYYVALVVTRQTRDQPEYVFLGDDKQIEGEAIVGFQHAVQTRGLEAEPEAKLPGADAYALIWKPLEKSLQGKTRIFLSPDGILNQLPLGVIAAPDGKLQMEKYDLRLLSSTRDLLRAAPEHTGTTALLVGDPVFDLTEEQQLAAEQKPASPNQPPPPHAAASSPIPQPADAVSQAPEVAHPSRDLGRSSTLPRLPGTGTEVKAIAQLLEQHKWTTSVYTGERAQKRVVEQTSSPRVLHLATHGFFLPDQHLKNSTPGEGKPPQLEDPMLRSGLYFAGANRTLSGKASTQGEDNGVLTSLEAGNLNLRGTELVVLSACNTGQGDVKDGEGVFGLRRALQEAGAQKVLMSLWSVPDEETLELMNLFYAKWLSGIETHQALKEAQLEMREKVRSAHDGKDLPYYWGAFVLVGR
jgi:tetratricopeptide (TPR) repeat protein/CHAT domain-containing protein